jgi:hypothetical protein
MSMADEFKGLPIEDLVGAPLIAAANAQGKLALTTAQFIDQVGMSNGNVRTVNFNYETSSSAGQTVQNTISVPLLSVVNIPSLAVKKANVDFTMEVKAQSRDVSSTQASISTTASYGGSWWSPVSVKVTGSVATSSEHTRATDKSAKYNISVEARDDGMPEGLARVLDILAANVKNPTLQPTP